MSIHSRLVIGVAAAGIAVSVAVSGCTPVTSSVSQPSPSGSPPSSTSPSPGGSPTVSSAPSVSRDAYTSQFAASVLKDYLAALVAKDAAAICALDVRTAPGNSKRLSQEDCISLMQGRITGKDWTNLEVDCWASAKDLAACAGMNPLAAKAQPNELSNFVFDSERGGFSFTAGTPDGCDPKNSTGCWFVVVYDTDGHVSVAPHWGERVYR